MKPTPHESKEFKHQFALCTCEMCTALKSLVVLLWAGTYLMFAYHSMQATAGDSIYGIVGAICYVSAFPTASWALGAWLDGRATKKS